MKFYLLPFFICCCFFSVIAQSDRAVFDLYPDAEQGRWQSPVYEIPLQGATPFLSYFLAWSGNDTDLHIRFSTDGENWSAWQNMPRDEHSPELPLSILRSTEKEMQFFQLENGNPASTVRHIACHFYSPGATGSKPVLTTGSGGRSCSDLAPEYIDRANWCPTGNCAEHPNPAFADVSHLVIHHSAGKNQSDDWPAEVRSIWDYHVNGRGWSDIGYNWLIDPEGNIYEGRSHDAIGAHFCGTNTGTIGICVLGNFMEEAPREQAIAALDTLLSWKACENGIDPLAHLLHASSGKDLPTIIGHRDGCATACPGDWLYPQLPQIRDAVSNDPATPTRERDQLMEFLVYPNPGNGQFVIRVPEEGPEQLEIRLFDLFGRQLITPLGISNRQHTPLDLSLPNGIYLLTLQSHGQVVGAQRVSIIR